MTEEEIQKKIRELEEKFFGLRVFVEISSQGIDVAIRKKGDGYKTANGKNISFSEALQSAFQEARNFGWVKKSS